jgi:hypothetical protein
MTIALEIDSLVEARLAEKANAEGIPLHQAAERILRDALAIPLQPDGHLSIDEFHKMLAELAEGSELLPDLPTEAFTRESFYRDCA